MLTVATVIQTLIDQIRFSREREDKQTRMVVGTIETIAGAIDAKDEYTGGHSERVGHYAAILARGMAVRSLAVIDARSSSRHCASRGDMVGIVLII